MIYIQENYCCLHISVCGSSFLKSHVLTKEKAEKICLHLKMKVILSPKETLIYYLTDFTEQTLREIRQRAAQESVFLSQKALSHCMAERFMLKAMMEKNTDYYFYVVLFNFLSIYHIATPAYSFL